MAEISYPADWRDIAPEKWAKMLLTPELYSAMRAERLAREAAAPAGKASGQAKSSACRTTFRRMGAARSA